MSTSIWNNRRQFLSVGFDFDAPDALDSWRISRQSRLEEVAHQHSGPDTERWDGKWHKLKQKLSIIDTIVSL